MNDLDVVPAPRPLHGELWVPGDKSISHRALLLAALAEGRSEIRGLSGGQDVAHTAMAIEAFGAGVSRTSTPGVKGGHTVTVDGGQDRLHEPTTVIDVGNSGTGIRLLAGWAAGRPGLTVLAGDQSVAGRPMGRVVAPLRAMGAEIDGRADGAYPPLVVRGGGLHGIDYRLPVASAQVKGAILLAALAADGPTTVREDIPTRRHTEEMLALFGVDVITRADGVTVTPGRRLQPKQMDVAGDPSQAAFWAVAATIVPGSELVIRHVYVGPGRAGFIAVLRRMGADIRLEHHDERAHTADLRIIAAPLAATQVGGDEVPSLVDEIPILAVAAAYAEGTTVFADATELRVKETDRIATITSELTAIGATVQARPDGLEVHGRRAELAGGHARSHGDHRIAMAMAIAGLGAAGPVRVSGWDAVATSYPAFEEDLDRCVS